MPQVLLVDDEVDLRNNLAEILQHHDLETVTAGDGAAALDLLRGGLRPSVVLLDLLMPVMDGWAFRQRQLVDPEINQIPVIVMSAVVDYSRAIVPLMLPKPINVSRLIVEVERLCGVR